MLIDMATKTRSKRPTKALKTTKAVDTPVEDAAKQQPAKTVPGINLDDLVMTLDARISESQTFWNGGVYKLEENAKANQKYYLGGQVADDDDNQKNLDNRIFSAIRTIVPYVTTRIPEPEVYPSSNTEHAKKFAEDFEKALHSHAKREKLNQKLKFALEDAIIRRRGYLKPRYDAVTKNFCSIEYVPCESIIIDHKAKVYEEPRYFRHVLDKTVEDLIAMFPEMKAKILETFGLMENSPRSKFLESHEVNEDWSFTPINGQLDLIVCWSYKKVAFGCIQDPNWNYDGENFLDSHMMPLIFLNVLNDGRTYVDKTSFVEQAKYAQQTIDRRVDQIDKNASLGSVGMPVVDSAAMAEDQAQYLSFDSDTVLELDVTNAGKNTINDVFTTWKAGPLSPDVYKDKQDAIAAVENAFGASSVMQGNQSDNNTLGQDAMLRDQSQGRQQEIVDAIDAATTRTYQLIAQFLLIYGEEDTIFKFVGENAEFDYIVMHSTNIDTHAEIQVKGGTSMPIDKMQRRATADKAAQQAMIDPLSYWEIMDQPNAEKYAKRLMDYKADPASFLKDTEEEIFNREAYVDLEILKLGQEPPFRQELVKEYFDHLNEFVLSGALEDPQLGQEKAAAISQFIDKQLARGQKMLGMAESQLPTPQDVAAHNAGVAVDPNADPNAPAPAGPQQPAAPAPAV